MLEAGRWEFGGTVAATQLDASHEVEPEQFEPGLPIEQQAFRHRLDLTLQNLALRVGRGLGNDLDLRVEVPLRRVDVKAAFDDQNGDPLPDFESIHHRTETVSGVGDVEVWLRRSMGESFQLLAGLSLPTGDVEHDPFEAGERGEPHQHLFFGSGTVDPLVGIDAWRSVGEWSVSGWARGRVSVGRSSEGYQAGERIATGVSAGRPLGSAGWNGRVQFEFIHEEPSGWRGNEARNSGRTDAILGFGVGYGAPGRPWQANALLRFPENLAAQGGQVDLAPMISFGVSWVTRPSAPGTDAPAHPE